MHGRYFFNNVIKCIIECWAKHLLEWTGAMLQVSPAGTMVSKNKKRDIFLPVCTCIHSDCSRKLQYYALYTYESSHMYYM